MPIKASKKRFEISMKKPAYEMIDKFSKAYHQTKSEFIVCCCMDHIRKVVATIEAQKQKKAKEKK